MQTWSYILVLLAAAVPSLEIVLVVPAAVIAGLAPFWVVLFASAGNAATVLLVITAYTKLATFLTKKGIHFQKQTARGERLLERYGLPGLALIGPVLIGTHLAAFLALALNIDSRKTARWMTAGIVIWAAAMAVLAELGIDAAAYFMK